MGLYDLACAAGPTLGPIVAGFAVEANGWRWAFWEMLWITGFALIVLSFTMPEVSTIRDSMGCRIHFQYPLHLHTHTRRDTTLTPTTKAKGDFAALANL
jgi:MFS family permease